MKNSSIASSESDSAPNRARSLRYLTWFGLGTVLTLALAEALLRIYVVPIDDGRANRVHLVYTETNPDVVLGDSHLYRAFINSERFVNLARGGSSPHALEIVAREYFRHRDPGRVIVEASPQLFNPTMQQKQTQRHELFFTLNFGLPFVAYVFEPGISGELAQIWDLDALRHKATVARGRKKRGGPVVRKEAARRRGLSAKEQRENALDRIDANRPVADVRHSEAFAAYRRLLEFLRERGANVCLARTPVTTVYREIAAEDPNFIEAHAALRDLAAELELRYVDYVDLGLPLSVTAFTNPDHLTTRAGERYAALLEAACFD